MRRVTLNDVCDVTDGTHYTPPNTGGPFPFLTVKDMTEKGLSFARCSYIGAAEFEKARKVAACPEAGTVLFSKDGTVAKVHVVRHERPFAVLSSIAILRPDSSRLDSKFLGFALSNSVVLKDAVNRKTGSALQRIILSDLNDVTIPLPDLSEQRRIAERLEQADRLRRTRRYALELTDTFLPAVFLELFGDPIRNAKGWSVRELEELATVERGKFTPRPRNDPSYYGGRFPFIQTGDISGSEGRLRSWTQTLNEKGVKVSRCFPPGTIVIAIVGATIGMTTILEVEVYCPDSVVGIQVNPKMVTKEYIEFLLRFWHPVFLAQAPETARANINLDTLRPLRIPVPTLPLQQKFAALVERVEHLRAVQRDALRQAEHLFASLLHSAFSG